MSGYLTNSFYAHPRAFIQGRYKFVASVGARGLSNKGFYRPCWAGLFRFLLMSFRKDPSTMPLTQPLDPVEEDLALLVAQKLMSVTVLGFAQDGAPRLDTDVPAEYPMSGHRGASLWSGPSEGGGPRGGHFFI